MSQSMKRRAFLQVVLKDESGEEEVWYEYVESEVFGGSLTMLGSP